MKCVHLTLRLAQFHSRGECFADGLSVDLARQTEVGAVTGLAGLMATTVRLSATALDGGDGAAAKIAELQDLDENAGTLLFEGGEGVGQGGLLS
jgi:hypothetical protein